MAAVGSRAGGRGGGGAGPAQLDPGDVGEEEPEGFKTGAGARPGAPSPRKQLPAWLAQRHPPEPGAG